MLDALLEALRDGAGESSSPRLSRSQPRPGSPVSRQATIRRLGHRPAHVHVRKRRRAGAAASAVGRATARRARRRGQRPPHRFLNVPATRLRHPYRRRPGRAAAGAAAAPRPAAAGRRTGQLVADFLGSGGDPARLVAALGSALVRENRNFHTIQSVEAAAANTELLAGTSDSALPLLAAARHLAAHATTTRSQRQTFEIARRLHRGERLYEDAPASPPREPDPR